MSVSDRLEYDLDIYLKHFGLLYPYDTVYTALRKEYIENQLYMFNEYVDGNFFK